MAQGHDIEVEVYSEDASVVALRGEHDLHSAADIAAALAVAAGSPNILVDLSGSTFIDSSVIGAILRAAAAARTRHADLGVVVGAAGAVGRALQLAGVGLAPARVRLTRAVDCAVERPRSDASRCTSGPSARRSSTSRRRSLASHGVEGRDAGFTVIRRPVGSAPPELRRAA